MPVIWVFSEEKRMSNTLAVLLFILLWIGPVIGGVFVAKKKNRSPNWFWLGIWPGLGLWVFIVFLFLKPLAICEHCKKKIPLDSRVCPYCANETSLPSKTEEEIDELKKNRKKKIIITVIIIILVFAIFCTFFFTFIGKTFKDCIPYKHSIELIENNKTIMDYLGSDYKQTGMIAGSLSTSGDSSGKATFSYKLKGKNGISRVYIDAFKENGIWNYTKINFYKEEQSPTVINLLAEE